MLNWSGHWISFSTSCKALHLPFRWLFLVCLFSFHLGLFLASLSAKFKLSRDDCFFLSVNLWLLFVFSFLFLFLFFCLISAPFHRIAYMLLIGCSWKVAFISCLFQRSLRGRRLEVVGERENGRARGRHARGEGAPARKAPENRFNSHSVSADISNWSRGSRGKN